MDLLLQQLDRTPAAAILVLFVAVVALAVFTLVQAARFNRMRKRWADLLEGTDRDNLERLLQEHLREWVTIEGELLNAKERLTALERKTRNSKRFLGFVRYDAFDDVGGSQSFSLALYDEEGNGAVVTSLVGRTDCRVYCKELSQGKPDRPLSGEEERALERAGDPRSRPRLVP